VIDIDAKCQHWYFSPELARVYSPLSYTETVIRDLPKAAHFWKTLTLTSSFQPGRVGSIQSRG